MKINNRKKSRLKSIVFGVWLVLSITTHAYESTLANMNTASDLDPHLMIVNIGHRFYGDVTEDTLDTFFGTTQGAEVGLFLRYKATDAIETNVGYVGKRKAYYAGVSYGLSIVEDLKTELRIEAETKRENKLVDRENHVYVTLENNIQLGDAMIHVNAHGIDGTPAATLGASIMVIPDTYLFTELYPGVNNTGLKYSVGTQIDTFGHQFQLTLQNATAQLERHFLTAKKNDYFMLGFNIKRLFEI